MLCCNGNWMVYNFILCLLDWMESGGGVFIKKEISPIN